MRKKSSQFEVFQAHFSNFGPPSIPFMPGIGLILLGLVIFIAPKFFLAAVATFFILLGLAVCYIAWKVIALKRQVSKLTQQFHKSVEVRAFQVQNNDDIDITVIDSKKTYMH